MSGDHSQDAPVALRPRKYDVALSFAGENRRYVEEVAECLKSRGVSVFYDLFQEVDLWGKDLYAHLADIYENQATYTVMFISREYAGKAWTTHERRSAQSRAFTERREYILPARFDDTELPGMLQTVGYVDLRTKTPHELCSLITAKLGMPSVNSSVRTAKHKPSIVVTVQHSEKRTRVVCLSIDGEPHIVKFTSKLGSFRDDWYHLWLDDEKVLSGDERHVKYLSSGARSKSFDLKAKGESYSVEVRWHEASGPLAGFMPGYLDLFHILVSGETVHLDRQ